MKRILIIALALAMLLSACGSLGQETAGDPASTETVSKNTMEYVCDWFQKMLPELGEPEEKPREVGDGLKWVMGEDSFYVQLFPKEGQPELTDCFNINIAKDAEEAFHQKYEEICTATALHFFEDLSEADVAAMFQITPVADENYRYEENSNYYVQYYPQTQTFIVRHYSMGYELMLCMYMETGECSFQIYPPVPCENTNVLKLQQIANEALSRAGHPITLSFWEHADSGMMEAQYFVGSVGGDEAERYSDAFVVPYIYLYRENEKIAEFTVETKSGASPEAQDAVRAIFTAVATSYCDRFADDAFLEAFFNMKNHDHYESAFSTKVYNEYGSYVALDITAEHEDACFTVYHKTDEVTLEYHENGNGTVRGTVSGNGKQTAAPIFLEDCLAQFMEKYPDATQTTEMWMHAGDPSAVTLRVNTPENQSCDVTVIFEIRLEDQAITKIQGQYSIPGTLEQENLLREINLDLAEICGISREDTMTLYTRMYEDGEMASGLRDKGIDVINFRFPDARGFGFEFTLEGLPIADNYFNDLMDGPSVADGRFRWLDFTDNDYAGKLLASVEEYLYEKNDVPLQLSTTIPHSPEIIEGVVCDSMGISLEATSRLDREHYGLLIVHDENPHFVMYYNEELSQLYGLPEGYYYSGSRPEELCLLPVCLSLMCDSDITQQTALELFCLEMEPSRTLADGTVTFYCPGEVAHILITNTKTGDNTYYAMTKADFAATYGDLDGFVAAWKGGTFLAAVKEAAKNE